jgi:hypothetical protein
MVTTSSLHVSRVTISLSTKTHIVELKLGNLYRAVSIHKKPPKKIPEYFVQKWPVASIFKFQAIYKGKSAIIGPKILNRL